MIAWYKQSHKPKKTLISRGVEGGLASAPSPAFVFVFVSLHRCAQSALFPIHYFSFHSLGVYCFLFYFSSMSLKPVALVPRPDELRRSFIFAISIEVKKKLLCGEASRVPAAPGRPADRPTLSAVPGLAGLPGASPSHVFWSRHSDLGAVEWSLLRDCDCDCPVWAKQFCDWCRACWSPPHLSLC